VISIPLSRFENKFIPLLVHIDTALSSDQRSKENKRFTPVVQGFFFFFPWERFWSLSVRENSAEKPPERR
jgi:hypothetical protein